MNDQVIFIYITVPHKDVALSIAHDLLERQLVACANMIPMASSYRWKGEVTHNEELVLLLKTFDRHYQAICREVEQLHPYDIVSITKVNVQPNEAFFTWMKQEIV